MSPKLMGVVNVTPDSFSDGGRYLDPKAAIAHGKKLVRDGADLVDVGGESTRPGATEVSEEEELARVVPVVVGLAGAATVSVDTSKLAVAEAALDGGASIVNDVTALRGDPEIGALCAARGAGLVLMHMPGDPGAMQQSPTYDDDVVDDVKAFLARRLEAAVAAGVAEEGIWLDPGIGFGKTLDQNLSLLRRLDELRELGRPLLVGTSRKGFLGKIDGSTAGDRLGGTIASSVLAAVGGADILRVHDVAETVQAAKVSTAILDGLG